MKEKEEMRFYPPTPLSHKTLLNVKDQQSFQDLTGFWSWISTIFKILTILGEKMAKIEKSQFL